MSKRLLLFVAVVSLIAGISIGYTRGLPNDFVDETAAAHNLDYGYRCGDGSEFTIIPSDDMSTLTIVPATSVEYIRHSTMHHVSDATTTTYSSGDAVLKVLGQRLELSTASSVPTMCTSMNSPEASLWYVN